MIQPLTHADRDDTLAVSDALMPGYDMPVIVPASAMTHEGFRRWAVSDDFPDRGLISYLAGEIWIDMSPESLESHNKVKSALTVGIGRFVDEHDLGEVYSDRTLITHERAELSTEPDLTFATWDTLKSGRLSPVPRKDQRDYKELEGTPDWVLEIVSDSSVTKDTKRLRRLYHKAGVPEYWIVDARGEEIVLRVLVRQDADYSQVTPREGWCASEVFDRLVKIERTRNPVGTWRYHLHFKPKG